MRAVLQRVRRAAVRAHRAGPFTPAGAFVPDAAPEAIGEGLVALVGVAEGDGEDDARRLARKIARLRIFEDRDGKMNESVLDRGGAVLAVSQFTLLADTRKGNRPSFGGAAAPELAAALFDVFVAALRAEGLEVRTGVFGADMSVQLTNEGPVTLVLDTR